VTNPIPRLTGAIHVYGGDFFGAARSEWDPDTLREQPFDVERARRLFAETELGFVPRPPWALQSNAAGGTECPKESASTWSQLHLDALVPNRRRGRGPRDISPRASFDSAQAAAAGGTEMQAKQRFAAVDLLRILARCRRRVPPPVLLPNHAAGFAREVQPSRPTAIWACRSSS